MDKHVVKHIFVTGGVVSSLGKGLTCSSIGMLLEHHGLRVRLQKIDPYLNIDPGTMSPYQHGEVYVLDDGAETDLDLGHYERFTHAVLDRNCNLTTGRIYQAVIEKERAGHYLGQTVQVIPHITDEIKMGIRRLATADVDVVITEIGGTVGDIEAQPFLEAARQYALEAGRGNSLFVHLTLVPYLKAAREAKTKPTQHSVGMLRQIGIQPDVLVCRTEHEQPLAQEMKDKIGLFCNIEPRAVIEERDKKNSIYEVPLSLADNGLDSLIIERLGLEQRAKPADLSAWRELVHRIKNPVAEVTIAVVGKYVQHHDAYKSIYEALDHAGTHHGFQIVLRKVQAEDVEQDGAEKSLGGVDGILVPGGFGDRGIEGKIDAITFARTRKIPFFGVCLGMQCAVIEFARNVLNLADANSTEFDANTPHPVICMLEEQLHVKDKGGTMRKGAYPCHIVPGTRAEAAYGQALVQERHRHRYEFNYRYREPFAAAGMVASGVSPTGKIVEIMEIPDHPWFLAVQFHPEFKSKPTEAHPLFREFIRAAGERREGRKEPGLVLRG
ncbi:MAG TPA: CTP synthase [Gemmatales bacterium]|nr:CTP synthase [Gemmatales bacterium]HMP61401.1 CTP synthase [Gemmatales bacterium]